MDIAYPKNNFHSIQQWIKSSMPQKLNLFYVFFQQESCTVNLVPQTTSLTNLNTNLFLFSLTTLFN